MYFPNIAIGSLLIGLGSAFQFASTNGTDALYQQGLNNLKYYRLNHTSAQCSVDTAYVRREWSTLSSTEKAEYNNAVLCLMSKPAISGDLAPGARSRYDDFVATHINLTLTIHSTGNFLSWHRYFIYTFEQALRNECNYASYLPYYNWGKYALDVLNSPPFDGSPTSLSGNGLYVSHADLTFSVSTNSSPTVVLPAGKGGGCVTTGPYANMTVRLGPVTPALNVTANPRSDGLGYNPRCLRRDISQPSASWTTDAYSTALITQNTDIASFQTTMQGLFAEGQFGVHAGGHYTVGGDPGGDFYASPGDPFFWLHHGMIDRTWWIWQNLDVPGRLDALAGTITFQNEPPSRNASLDDELDLGVNAEGIRIRDALSSLGGPFCYVYA